MRFENKVCLFFFSFFFFVSRLHFEKQAEVNATVLLVQGEAVQQLREALKILAERVLILEHMIGVHGEEKLDYAKKGLLTFGKKKKNRGIKLFTLGDV